MRKLGLLARKGGAGKTTLAAHLGVAAEQRGARTLLVDLDPQRSLARWWDRRQAGRPLLAAGDAARLPGLLEAAEAEGVGLVVVDTRPSVEADTAAVAALVDFCLVPTRPAILDLDAVEGTVDLLRRLRRPCGIVINAAPPARGHSEAAIVLDARQALARWGVPVAPVALASRAALAYALIDGRAVTEFEPSGKASREVLRLWQWIEETAWPPRRRSRRSPSSSARARSP